MHIHNNCAYRNELGAYFSLKPMEDKVSYTFSFPEMLKDSDISLRILQEALSSHKFEKLCQFEVYETTSKEEIQKILVCAKKANIISELEQEEIQEIIEDEEIAEQIEKMCQKNIMDIDPDSPFADTDLIVFKDDFKGIMPLNGIKKSEFKNICSLYEDICNSKTYLRLNNDKLTTLSKTEILSDIKTLLTRGIGRKLIEQIALYSTNYVIINSLLEYRHRQIQDLSLIDVTTFDKRELIESLPTGVNRLRKIPTASYISLAHELIHELHGFGSRSINSNKKPTLHPDYDNLEEQITITGFGELADLTQYDEFNERNFEAAFRSLNNNWHPRFGHHGVGALLDGTKINSQEVLYSQKTFKGYLQTLKGNDLATDLRESLWEAKNNFQPTEHFSAHEFQETYDHFETEIKKALNDPSHPWFLELMQAKSQGL